jgi:hypothetical protein
MDAFEDAMNCGARTTPRPCFGGAFRMPPRPCSGRKNAQRYNGKSKVAGEDASATLGGNGTAKGERRKATETADPSPSCG